MKSETLADEGKKSKEIKIFEEYPVHKAVAAMALPTIVSQIIFVIYNLADTWYVGLTEDANAVAAISLCLPVYTMMSGISNLFGIGGASVLARALGQGDIKKARRTFACSIWGAFAVGLFYALLLLALNRPLLLLIGADEGSIDYAVSYVFWTVIIGGIPTIIAPTFGHLIRAAGFPKQASFGMILGAVINIVLDPVLMFVVLPKGNEVMGAAMATAVSNLVAMVYFCIYIFAGKKNAAYSLKPFEEEKQPGTMREIVQAGVPVFFMIALAMLSNCFLNSMLSSMGSEAVAGVGIVRKVDQLAYAVNQGITQGMLPLVAYCYSSGRHKRMWKVVGFSAVCSEVFSIVCTLVSQIFAPELISIFIRDELTIQHGQIFLRVISLAIPIYTLTFVIIAVFQAVGRGTEPLILSILHKGSLDIVLMFVIVKTIGVAQITWASPVSEAFALIVGVVMILRFFKEFRLSADETDHKNGIFT